MLLSLTAKTVLAILLCARAGAITAPATQPDIKRWFDDLADRDPDVREGARVELLGIPRKTLPELLAIVEKSRPLRPSQISELHDIVTHVYLAGEPYDALGAGFLGLSWPNRLTEVWKDPAGLVIAERLKGFVAYRFLRDGDVLVGIEEFPNRKFNSSMELSDALREIGGGNRATLLVLRGGRVVHVPLELDFRPNWPAEVEQTRALRENKAEEYWDQTFGKVVGEAVSVGRP
jgi:hypothetical protein